MNKTAELIEIAKQRQGIKSDNAFAMWMGVGRQWVYAWKKGRQRPNIDNLEKIAKGAGWTIEEALNFLRSKAAAGLAIAFVGVSSIMAPCPAEAAPVLRDGLGETVYYVK